MVALRRFVSYRDADEPQFPNFCADCTSRWGSAGKAQDTVQLRAAPPAT